MAKNLLVINVDIRETRVALIENGIIAELHIERETSQGTLGNIYLGKVSRVLPGMQAAFIDIGLERAAFLHVEDLIRPDDFEAYLAGRHRATAHEDEDRSAMPPPEDSARAPAEDREAPIELPTALDVMSAPSGEDLGLEVETPSEPPPLGEPDSYERAEALAAAIEDDVDTAAESSSEAEAPAGDAREDGDGDEAPHDSERPDETDEGNDDDLPEPALESEPLPLPEVPLEASAAGSDVGLVVPAGLGAGPALGTGEGPAARVDPRGDARVESTPAAGRARSKRAVRSRGRVRRSGRTRDRRQEQGQGQGQGQGPTQGQAPREAHGPGRGGAQGGRSRHHEPPRISKTTPIREVVREGQEVMVQVSKEPIGTKGARVTSHVSLPGRYVVYLPTVDHIGISKRIGSEKERSRLRESIESMKPPQGGLIVRTVAEGLTKKQLKADVGYLVRLWGEVVKKRETGVRAPTPLYTELDLVLKTARDLFTDDIEKIIIDSREEYIRLKRFVETFMPERAGAIEYYDGAEPIFDAFGIEDEIQRALARKVPLASGGHLIIDQAEALTAIDVNTGRFVGKGSRDLEETILTTNLEAVQEIAYQLRFRNIGGLIILDLIDMERANNREKVRRKLEELLSRDKAKTTLNRISDLGLIEMTRKRTRESLGRTILEPCFYCDGTGQLQSKQTIAYEILRQIRRERLNLPGYVVVVNAHPAVVDHLKSDEREAVQEAERLFTRRIELVPRKEYHLEQFDLLGSEATMSADISHDDGTAPDALAEARKDERVTINKEFESYDAFISEYVTNISRTGVFVRSKTPLPIGTQVNLRFTVIMDDIETVEGLGEVVRVHEDPPGMGVVFTELSGYSKGLIEKLLTTQGHRPSQG